MNTTLLFKSSKNTVCSCIFLNFSSHIWGSKSFNGHLCFFVWFYNCIVVQKILFLISSNCKSSYLAKLSFGEIPKERGKNHKYRLIKSWREQRIYYAKNYFYESRWTMGTFRKNFLSRKKYTFSGTCFIMQKVSLCKN